MSHTIVMNAMPAADADGVVGAISAATVADGVEPVDSRVLSRLRDPGVPGTHHLLVRADGAVGGYGRIERDSGSGWAGEIVVAPRHRRRGIGRSLLEAMLGQTTGSSLRVWAHGHHPGARALAGAYGFTRVRDLWRMSLSLASADVQAVQIPEGITVRPFRVGSADRPGDEQEWLRLNAAAFADHPEQGAVRIEDLGRLTAEPWFDPAGFFLAERAGRLAGFHWTKLTNRADGTAQGEVYVLGIAPGEQGSSLGRALLLAGLHHLRQRGAEQVTLFTEADNEPAVKLYEKYGFAHDRTDVMYEHHG